jgi:trehalose 6-phosphate phosphatase
MAVALLDIEPLRPILSLRPFGLISDIDGTLSPIVPRPEEAYIPEDIRSLLEDLVTTGVFVALISGRTLADARRLVNLDRLTYAGNHGLYLWADGRQKAVPEAARYEAKARRALRELQGLSQPGVRLEDPPWPPQR